ncbi:MAG: sulfurtransferase TusA family protein [Kyrpidia tusciae]|nr:sulfurtransferase TusA family protein [Kyrpidia tusciae]MBE3551813.1 sulfurtransferase TusA family protein [Kyrpidia tusciae]
MAEDVALKIDAKGLKCPLPVVRVKKAILGIEVGQVIEVEATDPGSMADFEAWTRATGHDLLQASENQGIYVYRIRRTK